MTMNLVLETVEDTKKVNASLPKYIVKQTK